MRLRLQVTAPILLTLLLGAARPARAAWSTSGNAVIQSHKVESFAYNAIQDAGTTVCPDMDGGLICAWVRNSDSLDVSRLDADGNRVWGIGLAGIPLNVGGNILGAPSVVSDGNKGAWIVWSDNRAVNPGEYCQRVDFSGVPQLAAGGVRIGPASTNAFAPRIAKSATGKLLVAWVETNASFDQEIHVQRVALTGALELGATGVIAYTATTTTLQQPVELFNEGDGAVVTWRETTGSPAYQRILAQRLSASGAKQWGANGLVVEDGGFANSVVSFSAAYNLYGLTVAWSQGSGTARLIRAQRVTVAGVVDWAAGGVTVVGANATGDLRVVNQDTQGGAIVGWMDTRDLTTVGSNGFMFRDDLYAQRLDVNGVPTWTSTGQPVIAVRNDNLGEQDELEMVSDGANGAWFVFRDRLLQLDNAVPNGDIKLVRLSSSGASLFGNWVNRESTAQHDEGAPVFAGDNAGGVVVAWEDARVAADAPDVFATHRSASGAVYSPVMTLTSPNGGESFASLEQVPVTWTSSVGGRVNLDYSLNDGAHTSIATDQTDHGTYTWLVPSISSTQVRLHVSEAGDGSPSDSSNSFFSVCPSLTIGVTRACGTAPLGVVAGDFFEDGILDLMVANSTGVNFLRGGGSAGIGNGNFITNTANAVPGGARFLAAADFNGDGRLDVAASTPTGVRLLLGGGAGGVGDGTCTLSPTILVSGADCFGLVAADLNHDGITDLAVADSATDRVRVLKGLGANGVGNGTFSAGAVVTVGGRPFDLVAADFDDDGHLDLAVANSASNDVSVLLGNGDGTFAAAVAYAVGTTPHHIVTGDFDDDGITDLAVTSSASLTGLEVLLGNGSGGVGTGTFAPAVGYKTSGAGNEALAVVDLDADGRSDLAIANQSDFVQPMFGGGSGSTGNGTFATGGTISAGLLNPWGLAAGDFNSDGRPDLVATNNGSGSVSVYLGGCTSRAFAVSVVSPNGGENFFVGEKRSLTWARDTGVLATDLAISTDDGANYENVATGQSGTSFVWQVTGPATSTARFRVQDPTVPSRQDASGAAFSICSAFGSADSFITQSSFAQSIARGDFNKDGFDDLFYVVSPHSVGGIAHNLGLGNGQFIPTDTTTAGFAGEQTLALADVNQDGLLDVVATLAGGAEVFLGGGTNGVPNGAFFSTAFYRFSHRVPSPDFALGDVDGDGVDDLVAAGGVLADSIFVLRGDAVNGVATGAFSRPARFAAGASPQRIVLADFNEDGALDVAVGAGAAPFGVNVLLGDGLGGFGAPVRTTVPTVVRGLATGDFNEDGITDLAVATASDLSILVGTGTLGVGTGSFAAAALVASLPSGAGGQVAVADVNRDGIADLLVSDNFGSAGELRWFAGQGSSGKGDGTFAAPFVRGTGAGGTLVLGDFDRDGVLDVMVGGGNGGRFVRLEMGCTPAAGALDLTSADGGQFYQVGTLVNLTWTGPAYSQAVNLEISRDGGRTFVPIARNITGTSYAWRVTGPISVNVRFRVRDTAWPSLTDESAADNVVYLDPAAVTDAPRVADLSPGWPNPARGEMRFTLTLPREGAAFVDVFDLSGRRIRSLARGVSPAGARRLFWDGRDEHGTRVEGGIYFVRARAAGFEATRRVVLTP